MIDVHRTTVADLTRLAKEEGKTGQVAIGTASEGWQAPWDQASRVKPKGRKREVSNADLLRREDAQAQAALQRLYQGLPAVTRRTPDQRYQSLMKTLSEHALASIRATGQVHWPASIEAELKRLGWRDGDPRLARIGTLEGAKKQIEDLARSYLLKAGHQQADSDRKKVSLDWHGHGNHRLTLDGLPR